MKINALPGFALAAIVLALTGATPANAGLTIKFKSGDYDPAQVFVLFNTANAFDATSNGGALALKKSYTLADLSGGVTVNNFIGGVAYVSVGKAMTQNRLSDPSFDNPGDADYNTRWDKFEMSYSGTVYDVANMTGINSFAVPLQLSTFSGGGKTPQQTLGYSVSGNEMIARLGAITGDAATLKNGTDFLRILGPTTFGDFEGPYPSFSDYYDSVSGQSVTIADQYSRDGSTPPTRTQAYRFTASFGAEGVTLTGGSDDPGSVGQGHTILIPLSTPAIPNNLLENGFYGNNPAYTVDGADSSFAANDVYSAAVRDALAGFAIGYVGSDVIDPVTGVKFKEEESRKWFAANQPLAFDGVQPDKKYYNAYAAEFWKNSNSYGFPFSDKLHKSVQANLSLNNGVPVDTLEVTFLGDTTVAGPTAAPEPATVVYGALSICLWAAIAGRRSRKASGRRRHDGDTADQ